MTEPTREENLLDLAITDIQSATCYVGGKIQDHKYALAKLNFSVQETVHLKREVWNYANADWERMRDILEDTDWAFL